MLKIDLTRLRALTEYRENKENSLSEIYEKWEEQRISQSRDDVAKYYIENNDYIKQELKQVENKFKPDCHF